MRPLPVLVALVAPVVFASPALAGVTLVPTGPLVADGSTQATIRLYVDSGAKVRVKADSGKLGAVTQSPDGVVTVLYTPPAVTAARTYQLRVTGGGEDVTVDVPVVPATRGSLELVFDPPVLPATGTATVRITPDGASAVPADARRFLVSASSGTIDAPMPAGDGTWVARYTPPKGLSTPLPVVITAADAAAPDRVWGHALLPVTVRRSVSVDAKPGTSNVLLVGGRTYGPFPAAPTGKVAFEVELDPRQPTARLRSVNPDTSTDEREVPLPQGPPQIVFVPSAPGAPAQPDLAVSVRFVAVESDGDAITADPPRVSASRGTLAQPLNEDEGWRAVFTPPAQSGEAILSAEIPGAKADRRVAVSASVPTVTLVTQPEVLPKGATSFKVVARVKDAAGQAVVGRAPTFSVTGATISGTPKDNKDGTYTAMFSVASSATQVRVGATPAVDGTGQAPVRLVAWAAEPLVAANGVDAVTITVVPVDAWGVAVKGVQLRAGVPKGDGSVPATVTTDANGVARVVYTAGKTAGMTSVRVEGAGLVAEVPLWQSAGGAFPTLQPGGDEALDALRSRWQSAAPQTLVLREGTSLSGPPASIAVNTVPAFTTPGAALLVTVRVADGAGKGVTGRKLTVSAAPAVSGPVTDNRDGTYTFTAQLPAGVDGPVNLQVRAEGAEVVGVASLPTLAEAGGLAATAAPASGATPARAASSSPARAPAAAAVTPSGAPKLRASLALDNARGSSKITSNGEELLVAGADFATPIGGFVGVAADLQWLPVQQPFGRIGLDVRGNAHLEGYNLGDDARLAVQRDASLGVLFRRTVSGPLAVQGSLGGHLTSGSAFRYADDEMAEVQPFAFDVIGARLGAGLAVELPKAFVQFEIAETFAPLPVDTHAGLRLDVAVSDGMNVRLGGTFDYRTLSYAGDDEGIASVAQLGGAAQVGVSWTR